MYSTNPIHYYIGLAVIIFGGSSVPTKQSSWFLFWKILLFFCFLGFSTHWVLVKFFIFILFFHPLFLLPQKNSLFLLYAFFNQGAKIRIYVQNNNIFCYYKFLWTNQFLRTTFMFFISSHFLWNVYLMKNSIVVSQVQKNILTCVC